jgi:hypothetical protein
MQGGLCGKGICAIPLSIALGSVNLSMGRKYKLGDYDKLYFLSFAAGNGFIAAREI